jgi:hypothetical protein
MYIHENSLNRRNRLHRRRSGSKNKIIVPMVTIFFLSVIGTIAVYSPFDYIQVVAAAQQQDNHNNNTKLLSLSTISTAIGTGAAATGVIVTVPGFLSTRKQPKLLATYLLKIHNKYDELCKTTKPANKNKNEYLDFLDALRCDIIYLLQKGDINENQYKMLDDRITEYLRKATTDLSN